MQKLGSALLLSFLNHLRLGLPDSARIIPTAPTITTIFADHPTKMIEEPGRSYLPLIDRIDAFPYYQHDPKKYKESMKSYYYFMIDGYPKPFGYVHASRVESVIWPSYWQVDRDSRFLTLTGAGTFKLRSDLVRDTLHSAHLQGSIHSLKRWDEELFSVHSADGEHVLDMSILGSGFFGVVCSGVSLIAWTRSAGERKYWVQKRAMTKLVFPGKLDSAVGGNIRNGESPLQAMMREAMEEASIPEEYSKAHLKACGTISYHLTFDIDGSPASCPHILYAFELELPDNITPAPNDGEVELFVTMSEQEVRQALFEDDFKPIVAVQWLAHFYRHGIMTAENEKNFAEIVSRLHRKHDLFVVESA